MNCPKLTLRGVINTSGRVEITLFTGSACVILVGELKFSFIGAEEDVLAQVLCEADGTCLFFPDADIGIAADYFNLKNGLGSAKINCILVATRERRFYEVDFEDEPYKLVRSKETM